MWLHGRHGRDTQQRQPGHRSIGVGHNTLEQGFKTHQHLLNAGGIEQVGVVLESGRQPQPPFHHRHRQIKLGGTSIHIKRTDLKTLQRQLAVRFVMQVKHHLHDRRMAGIAHRLQLFHQLFERQFLVFVGCQSGALDPLQQGHERRVTRNISAQHQRIQEKPNQAFQFGTRAASNRCAHNQVFPACVPRQ